MRFFSRRSSIKSEVDEIIRIFESNNIPLLQQKLYELYSRLNKPGSGELITSYPEKDKLCEVFVLCLQYDWIDDSDIREVWAENAFYCIVKYLLQCKKNIDFAAGALNLFLTCFYGKHSLYPKFNDILMKTAINPLHNAYFSRENYNGGACHLIREFEYFASVLLTPMLKLYPQILNSSLQIEYQLVIDDAEFLNVSPKDILRKMKHIADIIESILDDM